MFQNRHRLFHRLPASPAKPLTTLPSQPAPQVDPGHRHPAMRGLNVSPVHGRHCICDRCGQNRAA